EGSSPPTTFFIGTQAGDHTNHDGRRKTDTLQNGAQRQTPQSLLTSRPQWRSRPKHGFLLFPSPRSAAQRARGRKTRPTHGGAPSTAECYRCRTSAVHGLLGARLSRRVDTAPGTRAPP